MIISVIKLNTNLEKKERKLWLFLIGQKDLKLFSSHISADSHETRVFVDEPIKSEL